MYEHYFYKGIFKKKGLYRRSVEHTYILILNLILTSCFLGKQLYFKKPGVISVNHSIVKQLLTMHYLVIGPHLVKHF